MDFNSKYTTEKAIEITASPTGTQVISLKMGAADPSPAYPKMSVQKSGAGLVSYGEKNDFPQQLINLNSKSPVNKAIIESTVTYICGKGVRDSETNLNKFVGVPNAKETWDEFIEKVARDYKTFGGFAWQVVKNANSETVSIFHQDFSTLRVESTDDYGNPKTWAISHYWPKSTKKQISGGIVNFEGINLMGEEPQMFCHWDYEPGLMLYAVPDYYAALEYIKVDGTLARFYNNSVDNGFTPSVVISMPSNPSPEQKAAFQREMEAAFAGAKGASSIVIVWGEDKNVKPEITPFQAAANANVFNEVEKIVFQKIMSANRLSSPTLAGVSGSGNLSGNAAEIVDSFVLFNWTVVHKKRRTILDKINMFTKINGTKAIEIDELDVLAKIQESEGITEAQPATLSRKNKIVQYLKKLLTWN